MVELTTFFVSSSSFVLLLLFCFSFLLLLLRRAQEPGYASSSDGLVCAKMAGLNPVVLARGYEILRAIKDSKTLSKAPPSEVGKEVERRKRTVVKLFLGQKGKGSGGSYVNWRIGSEADIDALRKSVVALMELY